MAHVYNKPKGPTAVGDVLASTRRVALKRSRAAIDGETWRHAVGRRIAERTEVGGLREGELTVYVASAAWAQELSLLTGEIVARVSGFGIRVERIRFRVRTELALRGQKPQPKPRPRPKHALPAELSERLSRIEDEELRAAITDAAGLALSRLAGGSEPASAGQRSARAPRAAEERNAQKDRTSAARSEASRRTPAKRSG